MEKTPAPVLRSALDKKAAATQAQLASKRVGMDGPIYGRGEFGKAHSVVAALEEYSIY
jgi:hypothetical protein